LSAAPAATPSALTSLTDRLGLTTPASRRQADTARATAEVVARERGETPTEFREGLVGPQAPLERVAKGVQRGALNTFAGLGSAVDFVETLTGIRTPVGRSAREMADALERWAEGLQPADPGFADRLAEGFGSMAAFILPAAGTQAAALRIAAMVPRMARVLGVAESALLEALAEAGDSYRDLQRRGIAPDEAARRAAGVFAQNAVLVVATNRLGIFADAGSTAARAGKSALMEGLQEVGQYDIGRRAAGEPFKPGVALEAGVIGTLVGGPTGAVVGRLTREPAPDPALERRGRPRTNEEAGAGSGSPPPIPIDDERRTAARLERLREQVEATRARLEAMDDEARQTLFAVARQYQDLQERLPEIEEAEARYRLQGLRRQILRDLGKLPETEPPVPARAAPTVATDPAAIRDFAAGVGVLV
jgi:hypothetical protein